MSILMQALKQQHQNSAEPTFSSGFWPKVALVLALLLASCIGALLAYWLTPADKVATNIGQVTPAEPAQPEAILTALTAADVSPAVDAGAITSADNSAAVTQFQRQLDTALTKPAAKITEQFESPPAVATMTAGTPAAEPQPLAETEISDELRDKFASALEATAGFPQRPVQQSGNRNAPATDIGSLDRQLQQQIPALHFEAHVYATAVNQRWVKVNGKTLQEGQWVTADIRIKEITPQFVLLQLGNQLFSMVALSEWRTP
ncbi:general secretion pathway protein GspB [Rheinheimera maricola]|uniref:General secretion pathway protein GspB n=1 Tax=Rheinheimera maricola TaxID=2793282 RepID=A0ABS7X9X3_9GAMM|nr:general secretion pathway protein GspB [Rheinheimera maricola]MBZ9612356.1 general secretion pathway protein GspB [Rheinheimera maricola]